jgi:hypothetical protein
VPGGRPPLRADAPPPSTGNELELPDLSADATIAPSSGDLDLGHQALATGPDLALEPLPAGRELELEALPELVPLPASQALRTDLDLSPTPADGSRHNLGAGDIGIEDNDLLFAGEEEEEAGVLPVDVDSILARSEPAGELSDGQFADELMSLVDTMFQEAPVASTAAAAPRSSSTQIVVSPLFRDFSVDEMVAVIEGLKLLTVERGEVILRAGRPQGGRLLRRAFRAHGRAAGSDGGRLDALRAARARPSRARRDHQDAPARLERAARVREPAVRQALSAASCPARYRERTSPRSSAIIPGSTPPRPRW